MKKQFTDKLIITWRKILFIPVQQSCFRTGTSATTALLELTDNILKASDATWLTLDFSKAFDTIYHELLCSKLPIMISTTHQLIFSKTIFQLKLKKFSSIIICPILTLFLRRYRKGQFWALCSTRLIYSKMSYSALHRFHHDSVLEACVNRNDDFQRIVNYSK